MTRLTLTLKMTNAQVVETSVTVNNNSPIQDYVHPDDQTQPFEMTPGFKSFTESFSPLFFLLKNTIYGMISLFKQNADEVESIKQKRTFFIQLRK